MVCRLSRLLTAPRQGLAMILACGAMPLSAAPAPCASATTLLTADTLRRTGTTNDAYGSGSRFPFWGRRSRRRVRHRSGPVRGSRIAACAVASAAAVALSTAGPALASGWSIQPTPNPAGTTRSYLTGVSCTAAAATACTAAGYSLGSPPSAPLGDRTERGVMHVDTLVHRSGAASEFDPLAGSQAALPPRMGDGG